LAAAANRLGATTVVEQRVDRFLKHSLLVPENDFRCAVHDQLLEPIVSVDDAAIQVVEIRRRESPAIQWDEGTEIRRNHRHDVENHPLRAVANVARIARVAERVDDLEPFEQHLLAMLRRLDDDLRAQILGELVDVEAAEELANRGRADVGEERGVVLFFRFRAEREVLVLVEELVDLDFLLPRLDDDVVRVVDDLLEITKRDVEQVAHRAGQGLEEPDVRDGNGELDVTHALAPHLAQGHFHAATVADNAAIANSLVFAAVAFPVLDRTEDALAEQAVFLRLERAVVDGLGLGDFAPRPPAAEPLELETLALLRVLGSTDLLG